MRASDPAPLFDQAQRAFRQGRPEVARAELRRLLQQFGEEAQALHLLALCEKRIGDVAAAKAAFDRAAALAPHDAELRSNRANLLGQIGESEAALRDYDAAIRLRPGFVDARFNRAILLQRLGRLDEAAAELRALAEAHPREAKFRSALGSVLLAKGEVDGAGEAFDEALAIEPDRHVALHGRARVAMERGESGAAALFRRALAQKPGAPDLLTGLAEALEAEGDASGLAMLREAVEQRPEWIAGLELLARMRAEAGDGDGFADHYEAAAARRPGDAALRRSHWRTLARAGRHAAALEVFRAARPLLEESPETQVEHALLLSEAGEQEEALGVLGSGPGDYPLHFTRGRVRLRVGDAAGAAADLERASALDPTAINAWAHLDLAWRLLDDARHAWLSGQPGLWGTADLPLDTAALDSLAQLLRRLHRTRAHPIGQSLRGGTQTRGRLFRRQEPEIAHLRDAIEQAVREHMRGLPAADPAHPLLRHRGRGAALAGSWSVRLQSHGFHVSHIHPEGILSSACYISLPEGIGGPEREGWLELGRPPAELGLPLEPLATIAPRPGRLALFPSYLFHGTRPFRDGERLTVAFDVVPA